MQVLTSSLHRHSDGRTKRTRNAVTAVATTAALLVASPALASASSGGQPPSTQACGVGVAASVTLDIARHAAVRSDAKLTLVTPLLGAGAGLNLDGGAQLSGIVVVPCAH